MKHTIRKLVTAALIAALYTGLTFMSNFVGLAYGPIQFRLSEALTVLPVFSPTAIWGITLGCFISNIMSFNPIDMIFGTVATLCAAMLTYSLRKIRFGGLPVISMLMPVIINAAVVGAEIVIFVEKSAGLSAFLIAAAWVGLGEIVVCVGLGSLLFSAVNKNRKALDLLS